jgi:hypothetical protein
MRWHESILEFKSGRYMKLALVLSLAAIAAYVWHEPPGHLKPSGGTWLGYTLGTVGAVLILWLMLLGVRKRRYRSSAGAVQGWTSAHIYIGTSLLVIASLHCGFEFGWNVHTLAYMLMLLVIVSGFFGVYAYLRYPELMTDNMGAESLDTVLPKIADLDRKCLQLALDLPDEVNAIVAKSTRSGPRENTKPGRPRWNLPGGARRLTARDAVKALRRVGSKFKGEQAVLNGKLLAEMTRKSVMVDQVRRDMRLRAKLKGWLYVHVPLSFALLAALIAHIVSEFFFW